jgi:3-hydroxyisobutyrate dehydrogenase-like beta-hydroxyacid dehydrogenase
MGGQGLFDFGEEVGAANLVKLIGNFLIGSAAYSLTEALSMAEKNGVDPKAVIDMLTQSLFAGQVYQNYGMRIATKTPPYTQRDIPLKDIGLFIETAQQVESTTPIANLLLNFLRSGEGNA